MTNTKLKHSWVAKTFCEYSLGPGKSGIFGSNRTRTLQIVLPLSGSRWSSLILVLRLLSPCGSLL